jgi:hypothetical protein
MVGGGDAVAIVHAPAVAEVRRRQLERPRYLSDQPFAIDPELWVRARDELMDLLERRGWPLLSDEKFKQRNFLLYGTTIVMEDRFNG